MLKPPQRVSCAFAVEGPDHPDAGAQSSIAFKLASGLTAAAREQVLRKVAQDCGAAPVAVFPNHSDPDLADLFIANVNDKPAQAALRAVKANGGIEYAAIPSPLAKA